MNAGPPGIVVITMVIIHHPQAPWEVKDKDGAFATTNILPLFHNHHEQSKRIRAAAAEFARNEPSLAKQLGKMVDYR